MWDFLLHSAWAWLGLGGISIIGLFVVAWFIPGFRLTAIEIIGGILAAGAIYAKGASDEKRKETARKEEAVKTANEDYAKIDARPDTADDVVNKLRRNGF